MNVEYAGGEPRIQPKRRMVSTRHIQEGKHGKQKRQDDRRYGDEVRLIFDPMAEEPKDQKGGQGQEWNEFVSHMCGSCRRPARPCSHPARCRDPAARGRAPRSAPPAWRR